MRKILLLMAHPRMDRSQVHARLFKLAKAHPAVTLVDIYAQYPSFDFDVEAEQARLMAHDVILFEHPIYWYSTPAILKEWQDLVLEHGFAYGREGDKLAGKGFGQIVSAGSSEEAYTKRGEKGANVRELFAPIRSMARDCQMIYIPPLVLYDAGRAPQDGRLKEFELAYSDYLDAIADPKNSVEALNRGGDLFIKLRQFMGV